MGTLARPPVFAQPPGTPPPFDGSPNRRVDDIPVDAFIFLDEAGNPVLRPGMSWEEYQTLLRRPPTPNADAAAARPVPPRRIRLKVTRSATEPIKVSADYTFDPSPALNTGGGQLGLAGLLATDQSSGGVGWVSPSVDGFRWNVAGSSASGEGNDGGRVRLEGFVGDVGETSLTMELPDSPCRIELFGWDANGPPLVRCESRLAIFRPPLTPAAPDPGADDRDTEDKDREPAASEKKPDERPDWVVLFGGGRITIEPSLDQPADRPAPAIDASWQGLVAMQRGRPTSVRWILPWPPAAGRDDGVAAADYSAVEFGDVGREASGVLPVTPRYRVTLPQLGDGRPASPPSWVDLAIPDRPDGGSDVTSGLPSATSDPWVRPTATGEYAVSPPPTMAEPALVWTDVGSASPRVVRPPTVTPTRSSSAHLRVETADSDSLRWEAEFGVRPTAGDDGAANPSVVERVLVGVAETQPTGGAAETDVTQFRWSVPEASLKLWSIGGRRRTRITPSATLSVGDDSLQLELRYRIAGPLPPDLSTTTRAEDAEVADGGGSLSLDPAGWSFTTAEVDGGSLSPEPGRDDWVFRPPLARGEAAVVRVVATRPLRSTDGEVRLPLPVLRLPNSAASDRSDATPADDETAVPPVVDPATLLIEETARNVFLIDPAASRGLVAVSGPTSGGGGPVAAASRGTYRTDATTDIRLVGSIVARPPRVAVRRRVEVTGGVDTVTLTFLWEVRPDSDLRGRLPLVPPRVRGPDGIDPTFTAVVDGEVAVLRQDAVLSPLLGRPPALVTLRTTFPLSSARTPDPPVEGNGPSPSTSTARLRPPLLSPPSPDRDPDAAPRTAAEPVNAPEIIDGSPLRLTVALPRVDLPFVTPIGSLEYVVSSTDAVDWSVGRPNETDDSPGDVADRTSAAPGTDNLGGRAGSLPDGAIGFSLIRRATRDDPPPPQILRAALTTRRGRRSQEDALTLWVRGDGVLRFTADGSIEAGDGIGTTDVRWSAEGERGPIPVVVDGRGCSVRLTRSAVGKPPSTPPVDGSELPRRITVRCFVTPVDNGRESEPNPSGVAEFDSPSGIKPPGSLSSGSGTPRPEESPRADDGREPNRVTSALAADRWSETLGPLIRCPRADVPLTWALLLPGDRHVIRSGDAVGSLMTWRMKRGSLRRVPIRDPVASSWIDRRAAAAPGHRYYFTAAGIDDLTATHLSRTSIWLVTSLLVLIVAWAWLTVPRVRHPLAGILAVVLMGGLLAYSPDAAVMAGQITLAALWLVVMMTLLARRLSGDRVGDEDDLADPASSLSATRRRKPDPRFDDRSPGSSRRSASQPGSVNRSASRSANGDGPTGFPGPSPADDDATRIGVLRSTGDFVESTRLETSDPSTNRATDSVSSWRSEEDQTATVVRPWSDEESFSVDEPA